MKIKTLFLILIHCIAVHADNLEKLRDAIVLRFEEIHRKQTEEPKGIWYSNYLATLLHQRGISLLDDSWTGYCDPQFFEKVDQWVFKLRPGIPATAACQQLIDQLSILDCGNVTQLIYYLAISDVMGKEVFDRYVAKSQKPFYIATYTDHAPQDSLLFDFLKEVTISSPSLENQRPLEIGQLVYFRNYPTYLTRHPTGVAQGYNAIYIGRNQKDEQLYSAFWKDGAKTEREIITLLKRKFYAPQDHWDKLYLAEHPGEKGKADADPKHVFFIEKKIFSYVVNVQAVQQLLQTQLGKD